MFKRFWKDESGGSAAEYALIIAVVGPGIGAAALVLGANVSHSGSSFSEELDSTNALASQSGTSNGQGNGGGQGGPNANDPSNPVDPVDPGTTDPKPVNCPSKSKKPGCP
ncbi:Flp family type IVb pilin [Croceicoccus naphthovorans]|uniref:Flp family type IVb pilin n=1 Tax=Croceicoccus naphthovorans TaxID=1348774 RepID=UPI00069D4B7A|nr:Flp family type IVb pilin [Croceicoccus naphthovorans]MBB3989819.1 Flp pilus assembly pilin Flp [Croceicoccus naphthovorans]